MNFQRRTQIVSILNAIELKRLTDEILESICVVRGTKMETPRSQYDPFEGLTINKELNLSWEDQGDIREEKFNPYRTISKIEYQAAGLYAFVLDFGNQAEILYIGKAGGLKPKTLDRWANGIFTRAMNHWKSGPFRGLVLKLEYNIHLWTVDLRKEIGKIGERDIERIENELLRFLSGMGKKPQENRAIEGGRRRHFQVQFHFALDEPLPRIVLQPGECEDSRRKRIV